MTEDELNEDGDINVDDDEDDDLLSAGSCNSRSDIESNGYLEDCENDLRYEFSANKSYYHVNEFVEF